MKLASSTALPPKMRFKSRPCRIAPAKANRKKAETRTLLRPSGGLSPDTLAAFLRRAPGRAALECLGAVDRTLMMHGLWWLRRLVRTQELGADDGWSGALAWNVWSLYWTLASHVNACPECLASLARFPAAVQTGAFFRAACAWLLVDNTVPLRQLCYHRMARQAPCSPCPCEFHEDSVQAYATLMVRVGRCGGLRLLANGGAEGGLERLEEWVAENKAR